MMTELDRVMDLAEAAAVLTGSDPNLGLHNADGFVLRNVDLFDEIIYHIADGVAWLAATKRGPRATVWAYTDHRPNVVRTPKRWAKVAPTAAVVWIENGAHR